MKIFFKYVLKSMLEKKGRFSLLLIAISISTALVVAGYGMKDIIINSFISPMLATFENREISIRSTDKSAMFFSEEGIHLSGVKKDSILKEIIVNGILIDKPDTDDETMLTINVFGRENKYINENLITQGNLEDFEGEVCIISERIADERNLNLGDTIEIVIGGKTKKFEIKAISGSTEVFYNDSKSSFTIIIPYEYISKDFEAEGKYNAIFMNSSESTIQEGIDQFNKSNTAFTAEALYDEDMINEQLSQMTGVLYAMFAIVIIMSAIIIYSSFKLIITERLSTIGTFLSQGATTFKVKFILYLESITYGLFGAFLGSVLGVFGLYIINRYLSPLKDYGIYGKLEIKPDYIILGILFAVVLSYISSYLPVRKISKLQVKDVILNDVRISKTIGWKKFIIGTGLLTISLTTYFIYKEELKGIAGLIIVSSIIGVILAYPKLIDLLSRLLYRALRGRSSNIIFAINNLRTSKVLLGNITLIIISLIAIITISSLATSMIQVVTEAYTGLNYDIQISNISTIRENTEESTADYLIKELKKLGIKEEDINAYTSQSSSVKNPISNKDIYFTIMGINPDTFSNFNQYLELDKEEYRQYIKDLKNDNASIIITTALNKMLNKKVGDSVKITCNEQEKSLKIVGIIDGKLFNNGYIGLINSTTMKQQYGISSANGITFETDSDLDKVTKELKPTLRKVGATSVTKEEQCEKNIEMNEMLVKALNIFAYLAIVIAALGMINNILISFLQRKVEFAVLSSVGMENGGRNKILFFESIASVTWAMLITSLYCIFELKLVSILMKTNGLAMDITLNFKALPLIYFISLGIVLLATIPVLFKSRKLSIIQELKYE